MPDDVNPWAGTVFRFRLKNAHLTAIRENNPVPVEQIPVVVVEEGRYEIIDEDDMDVPERFKLGYQYYVSVEGAGEFDSWSGDDAQIVIAGAHENGAKVTIVGRGAIGRDNNGNTEIVFDMPPTMVVIDSTRVGGPSQE